MSNLLNQLSHEDLQLLDEILGKTKLALVRSNGDAKVSKQLSDMLSKIRKHPFYNSNEYEVIVTKTIKKTVIIEANSPAQALELAKEEYENAKFLLDNEDELKVNFDLKI